jgi:hypothetical protein
MATSDGDVIMTDSTNGNTTTTTETNATTATTSSSSTAQLTRTDHDRQATYYFLPTQALKRSRPHVSQNLISDYGLDSVHNRVRRVNPNTGEKINKLRKSYVGIVKNLHLAGSNKEVPTPGQWLDTTNIHNPQGLLDKHMVKTGEKVEDGMKSDVFEEEFKITVKPVDKQRAQGLLAKLGIAMQIVPGRIEDADKWKKMLGEEYPKKPTVAPVAALRAPGAISAKPSPKLGPTAGRTMRAGAKRSYGEASYAGYDESFEDVQRPSAEHVRKKQRKVPQKSPLESAPRQTS